MSLFYCIRLHIGGPLKRRADLNVAPIDQRVNIFGFQVVNYVRGTQVAQYCEKIQAALDLIRSHDSRRFTRLQRDMDLFVIDAAVKFDAVYCLGASLCVLTPTLLEKTTGTVACAIVHEAAHARLDHAGVWQTTPRRARVERICCREEITFAKTLPSYPALEEWIAKREAKL